MPCHAPRAGERSWRPSQGMEFPPMTGCWDSQLMVGMGAVAKELLLPVPGVLALLRDLGSDDFMALLRTNFHPGRENKQV